MEAFEGNRDIFKSIGEKAKHLGKVALKEAKKVAGLHVGQVTEANPAYYIVVAPQGAMVRKDIELDSPAVHGLRRGDLVTCVDVSGRRGKIIDPVEGWVSIKTQDNEVILELTIAPDKRTQVMQMERRFEKLKAEQQQQGGPDPDKAIPAAGQAAALPEIQLKEADVAGVASIKTKLTFKSSDTSPSGSGIPKLGGPVTLKKLAPPGSAKPSGQVDLFGFDSPKAYQTSNQGLPPLVSSPVVNAQLPVVDPFKVVPVAPVVNNDPFAGLFSPMEAKVTPSVPVAIPATIPPVQQENTTATKSDFDDWFS